MEIVHQLFVLWKLFRRLHLSHVLPRSVRTASCFLLVVLCFVVVVVVVVVVVRSF